ncbi:MAG: HpcH/HpaI aldolase/citrate lyase family protein [Ramlibacter sp.]
MPVFRSFLFAPGNHARRVEKCLTLGADAVILDLEDAVANAEKAATRSVVVEALQRPRRCQGYVRVNSLGTQWCHGDFVAVVAKGVDGIIVPKIESAGDLQTAEWLLTALERERGLPEGGIDLIPIIETAAGFSSLASIARAARRTRRLAFGAGDFTLDVGITWSRDETELLPYRSAFVVESRAAGLEPPLDTVWVSLNDPEGFQRSVQRAKDLGFQGKLCIHPDQVPVVNDCFRPTDAELAHARKVLAAFAQAERDGLAAIQVDGQFVDYPIVYRAQRLVARADAIAAAQR